MTAKESSTRLWFMLAENTRPGKPQPGALVSSPCLLWTGELNAKGYGIHWVNWRMFTAHRVAKAWADGLDPGSVPSDRFCRHMCWNKNCVRPEHLLWGTHADNTEDERRRHEMLRARLQEARPYSR